MIKVLSKKNKLNIKEYFFSLISSLDLKEFIKCLDKKNLSFWFRLIQDLEVRIEVFSLLEKELKYQLVKELRYSELVLLINGLESDDAVDVISKFALEQQSNLLDNISSLKRRQIQELILYPYDTAGGIMQVELAKIIYKENVASAVNKVRELVDKDVEVLVVWVVNEQGKLLGSVELVDLLLHKTQTPIVNLMENGIVFITPLVDQEKVVRMFQKYNLTVLPVVDSKNSLLGRIVIDDIINIFSEEVDEDTMHMAGTSKEEFEHIEKIWYTVRIRFPWLAVALSYSLISAFLLKFFEFILNKALFCLILLPVITAMAGNIGTQSATILIRSFASGKYTLNNLYFLAFKEVMVGIIIGFIYGFITGLIGTFVFADGNCYVGLCVLFSMMIAMSIAGGMGIFAPSLLRFFSFDPAIAAGPFVTTLNDITGVLVFLVIINIFLFHVS